MSVEENDVVVLEDIEKELGVEIHEFVIDNQPIKYKILNITKPEQWQDAKQFTLFHNSTNPGMDETLVWELKGISYQDVQNLNELMEEPVFEERQECSLSEQLALKKHFESERAKWESIRKITLLELATGYTVPGESIEGKIEWLDSRDGGETEALNQYISDICTGLAEGKEHQIMKQIAAFSATQIKKASSFNDWVASSETQAIFRTCRPFQDYVIQIKLKGISNSRKKQIDSECITPAPPKVMGIDPSTQRPSPRFMKDNPRDPEYIKVVNAINTKWLILILEECLPFAIPGDSIEDKKNWISERLAGDILKLSYFVKSELCGVLSRYNFFTKGSVRQS